MGNPEAHDAARPNERALFGELVRNAAIEGSARDVTERYEAEERLRQRERDLAETQALVHLGSWNWDVAADVITWSDELYRIYGLTPGQFEATYESFLGRLHPDDQQIVADAVQRSFGTGEPFAFLHRIVRPDGSIRWLQGQGEVVQDDQGETIRMYGTALDVTEQREAADALERSERRFRVAIESAPDALIGINTEGRIVMANDQAQRAFGYTDGELLSMTVEDLLPPRARDVHLAHRAGYMTDPRTRPMGSNLELAARRKDGSEFPVDISLSAIETDDGTVVTAFVRDITERKQAEDAARALRDAKDRRRQALEINDKVVQGIAAAVYSLESGDGVAATKALGATLDAAREMMSDLFSERGDQGLQPGELIRAQPASVVKTGSEEPRGSEPRAPAGAIRVVLADDTADIRLVLRHSLTASKGFEVVGEAENGAEAILRAKEQQPDIVLLDLAMPVMDGLQALPKIKAVAPGAKVVVLSGYARGQAERDALERGAEAYFEKGGPTAELATLLRTICAREAPETAPPIEPLREGKPSISDLEMLMSTYSHELRTVLTVIQGVTWTLRDSMDALPSPVVQELLDSLARNGDQMAALLDAFSDARRVRTEGLSLLIEESDVAALVSETVADLSELTKGHRVTVTATEEIHAPVDAMRVRQVIANLLSNAAKFSPLREPIDIIVSADPASVVVAVKDRGQGIPADRTSQLFKRFSRLTDSSKGLGLGLYISKGIAQAHGGDLVLSETSPAGSTFVLTLPLERKRADQQPGNGRD